MSNEPSKQFAEHDLATACESLRQTGHAMIAIADALAGLEDREAAVRVLRAVAILHGIELERGARYGR